jgi:membrane-associated phospholipid phosphatase
VGPIILSLLRNSRKLGRPRLSYMRVLAILAPVLLLAFAAVRLAATHDFLNLDTRFSFIIRQELSRNLIGDPNLLLSLCDLQIWDTVMVLLAVALWLRRHRMEAVLLCLGLTVDVVVEVMKALETPVLITGSPLADLLAAANAGSFPSGHVARTAVSVGLLVALFAGTTKQARILAIVLAAGFLTLVGAVSIKSGGHTLGEVLGGYLLAALWIDLLLLIRALCSGHLTSAPGRPPRTAQSDGPGDEPG